MKPLDATLVQADFLYLLASLDHLASIVDELATSLKEPIETQSDKLASMLEEWELRPQSKAMPSFETLALTRALLMSGFRIQYIRDEVVEFRNELTKKTETEWLLAKCKERGGSRVARGRKRCGET